MAPTFPITEEEAKDNQLRMSNLKGYLKEELEDLALPPNQRHRNDTYTGDHKMFNQQFVLDAPRSCFRVSGIDYIFNSAKDSQDEFITRLSNGLRECLGSTGDAPQERADLTKVATLLLSQSGLALVDLSCVGPHLALSGGSRYTFYKLEQVNSETWELRVNFRGEFFNSYVEASQTKESGEMKACSTSSSVGRGCVLHLRLRKGQDVDVAAEVEVKSCSEHVSIFDVDGNPVVFQGRGHIPEAAKEPEMDEDLSWWVTPSAISGSALSVMMVVLVL